MSPTLHNAWITAAGLDAAYVAFPVPQGSFTAFVEGVRRVIRGVNVTAPFKGEAFAIADQVSPAAQRLGAANLLVFEIDGTILAENTDGEGLLAAFAEQAAGHDLAAGPAVVIGAGGAAR
ncbi:MAG: shikimate dehydrogenase, partial [Caulobacteraceae bacterium]